MGHSFAATAALASLRTVYGKLDIGRPSRRANYPHTDKRGHRSGGARGDLRAGAGRAANRLAKAASGVIRVGIMWAAAYWSVIMVIGGVLCYLGS